MINTINSYCTENKGPSLVEISARQEAFTKAMERLKEEQIAQERRDNVERLQTYHLKDELHLV